MPGRLVLASNLFFIENAHFESVAGDVRAAHDFVEAGDRYRWKWRQDLAVAGEVTNVVPNQKISFTFGSMKVSVYFTTVEAQTELHLVQIDIPDTPDGIVFGHLNCRSCWVFFLTNLTSVLAFDRDLRDSRSDRAASMEVGFEPLSRRAAASA